MELEERLALANAIEKRAKKIADECKQTLRDDLLASGYDRKSIIINGSKIGEVSISYTKPKPCVLFDKSKEAFDFFIANGLVDCTKIEQVLCTDWYKRFSLVGDQVIFNETGEVCDFLIWQPSTISRVNINGCKSSDDLNKAEQSKFTGVDVVFSNKLNSAEVFGLLE